MNSFRKILDKVKDENIDVEFFISEKNSKSDLKKLLPQKLIACEFAKMLADKFQNFNIYSISKEKLYTELKYYAISTDIPNEDITVLKMDLNNNTLTRVKNFVNKYLCDKEFILYGLKINSDTVHFRGNEFLKNLKSMKYGNYFEFVKKENLSINQALYLYVLLETNYDRQKHNWTTSCRTEDSFQINNINNHFNQTNIHEQEIINSINGRLGSKKLKKMVLHNEIIETQFTDFQAFHICKGHRDKIPQNLYNKYRSNNLTEADIFFAHKYAMDILEKYGLDLVKYILTLPELPFHCDNFKILFTSLDKSLADNNGNPVVKLKIKNHRNLEEEVSYSFYTVDGNIYRNVIRIQNHKGLDLFKVNREGKVLPEKNNEFNRYKNVTPTLELFYHLTKDENNLRHAILSYGIKTGNCSLCGRELTNKVSKAKGIGPTCEKYL